MTLLLNASMLTKSFGSRTLFQDICFSIHEGYRIGLVGPNGAGKSTLVKIILGLEKPDEGTISRKQRLSIGYAAQSPEFPAMSLEEYLLVDCREEDREEALLRARIILDKAGFVDFTCNCQGLSGGWKKRLDIARVFMEDRDLIVLDEPTNYLDLEGILWLEKFLQRQKKTYLIVSHDRYFLENVCNRIMELNPIFAKGIFTSEGGWFSFLKKRLEYLTAQAKQERSLSSLVREEIEWMNRSPKARTKKSKSRVQQALDLAEQLQSLQERNTQKIASIDFDASQRETRNLLVAKNLKKELGGKILFQGVDLKLSPGTRLGIVGRNGTGKTTLLRILAGEVPADLGTVKYAQDIRIVYFDQHRQQLDPKQSIRQALSPNGEFVCFRGQEIHVHGWAKRFLFPPHLLNLSVGCLSGGERARILLARLMLQPADVLFLDEPTNDLDVATLDVLENTLREFPGAIVLISHDRCLMDRICTQILGLGHGKEGELFADYAQWESTITQSSEEPKEPVLREVKPKPKKLSYAEQKELSGMEAAILSKEEALGVLQEEMQRHPQKSAKISREMAEVDSQIQALYHRWDFLQKLEN